MSNLTLSEAEAEILREAIGTTLRDLSYEIANTDSKDYRDQLKSKRDVLAKLEALLASSASNTGPATR